MGGGHFYLGEGESPEDPQDKEGDGEADNKELEDGLGNEDSQPPEHLHQKIKKVESYDEKEKIYKNDSSGNGILSKPYFTHVV